MTTLIEIQWTAIPEAEKFLITAESASENTGVFVFTDRNRVMFYSSSKIDFEFAVYGVKYDGSHIRLRPEFTTPSQIDAKITTGFNPVYTGQTVERGSTYQPETDASKPWLKEKHHEIFVVTVPGPISPPDAERIKAHISETLGDDCKVIVTGDGIRIRKLV